MDLQRKPDVRPLAESDAYPAMPEDGYGWEKLFTERLCRHYTEDYGLETRVVRFHNIFGPLGTFDGGRELAFHLLAIERPQLVGRQFAIHQSELTGALEQQLNDFLPDLLLVRR